MAVSRRLRLRGEMERLFSRSFKNAATNGASISSKVNREGGLCRRFSENRNRSRNVSRYEAMVGVLEELVPTRFVHRQHPSRRTVKRNQATLTKLRSTH